MVLDEMGRPPCCDKSNVKRGLWTAEEDAKILAYISTHGTGNWTSVPKKAGLKRCGKSCRLRWTNYLRPDLKHDSFTSQEEDLILSLHSAIGSRWSIIAGQLPGRTDNDVKNYWNTKLRKKLFERGIDPVTHKPFSQIIADYGNIGLPKCNGIGSKNSASTRYQTSNKNQISCLNRDLRKAFMPKLEPLEAPQKELSNGPTPSLSMEPTPVGLLNNNPTWDLLAQLQAIKLVADASNCTNQGIIQPYFFNESSSSTSITTHHQDNIQATAPPIYPSQQPSDLQNTPSSSFSWSDFLLDNAFDPPGQQELQKPSSAGSLTNQIHEDVFVPNPQCKFMSGENRNPGGAGDMDDPMLVSHGYNGEGYGMLGDDAGDDFGVSSGNSFVETILDRESEMLWDFSDLLDDQFDYS